MRTSASTIRRRAGRNHEPSERNAASAHIQSGFLFTRGTTVEQHLIALLRRTKRRTERSAFIVARKFTGANEDIRRAGDTLLWSCNKVVIIKRAQLRRREMTHRKRLSPSYFFFVSR